MPKPLAPDKKRRRICEAAYKSLLKVLQHGRAVTDPRTGQQARDDDGRPIFTPPTAADIGQARQMARELEREINPDTENPYAQYTNRHVSLRDALIGLGYSARETDAIITAKKDRSSYDELNEA